MKKIQLLQYQSRVFFTDNMEDFEATATAATSASKEQPRKKKKLKKRNEDVVEGLNNLRG